MCVQKNPFEIFKLLFPNSDTFLLFLLNRNYFIFRSNSQLVFSTDPFLTASLHYLFLPCPSWKAAASIAGKNLGVLWLIPQNLFHNIALFSTPTCCGHSWKERRFSFTLLTFWLVQWAQHNWTQGPASHQVTTSLITLPPQFYILKL